MTKVIAILGAGSGLAVSVARRYGKQGYAVALVARNPDKLQALADGIASEDVGAIALLRTCLLPRTQAILARFGRIDILYYAPNPVDRCIPAMELTPEALQQRIDLYFYGLVAAVNAVLPVLLERGEGRVLSGFGGSAQVGFPGTSGTGPAMAAARNYLQSLQQELVERGIEVDVVAITAAVRNSAFHRELQAGGAASSGITSEIPEAAPEQLAELLDEAASDPERLEACFPTA